MYNKKPVILVYIVVVFKTLSSRIPAILRVTVGRSSILSQSTIVSPYGPWSLARPFA